jgi:single-stranded DNA-binding protein
VAGNRIELWGRILGEPEFRVTPAGTALLRLTVDCAEREGDLAMAVVMTGEGAERSRGSFKPGAQVKVAGTLKTTRRRLKSGLYETAYEVMAASIAVEN